MKLLKTKDRFEAELWSSLSAKGFESASIGPVIDHLIRRRIVNDRRTTQNLVARMTGRRAAGIEKLRAELKSRGAPEDIIEECLAEISPADQAGAIRQALSGKFKPTDDRAKAGRFLMGRGFAEEEIESALEDYFRVD